MTETQVKILQMFADGFTNSEIAAKLNYSYSYLSSASPYSPITTMYRELGVTHLDKVTRRTAAVAEGFRRGIIH